MSENNPNISIVVPLYNEEESLPELLAWIERVSPEAMALACIESETLPPLTMFKILRTQMDELGVAPDHRIHALAELPALVSGIRS